MYRKARIFEDYAVAEDIMATQLPEAVIEVLFGESLEPSMAQRAGSSREHAEKIYKDVVGSIKALGRKVGSSPNAKKPDNSLIRASMLLSLMQCIPSSGTASAKQGRGPSQTSSSPLAS